MYYSFNVLFLWQNLGVTFNSSDSFYSHIAKFCRSCYYDLSDMGRLCKFLSTDTAILVTNTMTRGRLDWHNSLLYGFNKTSVSELQKLYILFATVLRTSQNESCFTMSRKTPLASHFILYLLIYSLYCKCIKCLPTPIFTVSFISPFHGFKGQDMVMQQIHHLVEKASTNC